MLLGKQYELLFSCYNESTAKYIIIFSGLKKEFNGVFHLE